MEHIAWICNGSSRKMETESVQNLFLNFINSQITKIYTVHWSSCMYQANVKCKWCGDVYNKVKYVCRKRNVSIHNILFLSLFVFSFSFQRKVMELMHTAQMFTFEFCLWFITIKFRTIVCAYVWLMDDCDFLWLLTSNRKTYRIH